MDFSLHQEIGATASRAIVMALVLPPIAARIQSGMQCASPRMRVLHWAALVLSFLTPALFNAYALVNYTGWLAWPAPARELGYAIILGFRFLLPAVLVFQLFQPRLSREALHLLKKTSDYNWFVGSITPETLAGFLIFLLVFAEFEYASFFLVSSWTVKLFDAQAGGLLLSHSLKKMILPFVIEALVLVKMLLYLHHLSSYPAQPPPAGKPNSPFLALPWIGILLLVALPILLLSKDLGAGARLLSQGFVITEELKASLLLASLSAIGAFLLCDVQRARVILALPGLLGPLILGLTLMAIFQLPFLHRLYDSILPLLIATILWILPVGIFYRYAIGTRTASPGAHLGQLSKRPAQFRWELDGRYKLTLFLILFCLAWFDLTLSSLLSPGYLTPLPVRLYNFMHYQQNAPLTAMVFFTILTPAAIVALAYPLTRIGTRLLCGR